MRERPKNALTAHSHNPSRQTPKTQKGITALFTRTYGLPGGMVSPKGDHVLEIGCVTATATATATDLDAEIAERAENAENGLNPGNSKRQRF